MLNEIRLLTKLELYDFLGWNRFYHSKSKKDRRNYLLVSAAMILVILMMAGYVGALCYGLIYLGLSDIVISYLVLIASLLIIAFGFFKVGNVLFRKQGYDLAASLPVNQSSIVISRFLSMYVEEYLIALCAIVPGVIVYGIMLKPSISFYFITFIGTAFLPMIPLVIISVIGTVILAISSKMKHKTLVEIILTVLFVVIILIVSFGSGNTAENFTMDMWKDLAVTINQLIKKIYPPAVWFGEAAVYGNFAGMLLYGITSLGAAVLFFAMLSKYFQTICRKLHETSAKHDYKMKVLKSSQLLPALYQREFKRYFSSTIYVTNTIIGPIMGMLMAAAIGVIGIDKIVGMMEMPGFDLKGILPFLIAGIFTMMTTTSVSISMEGKQFWLLKSLPIHAKTILDSKILFNLSLIIPFFMISEMILLFTLDLNFLESIYLVLIPLIMILFSVVFGITVNLKLHRFDWEREETIVKQSASAFVGGFAGPLLSLISGVICTLTKTAVLPSMICLGIATVTMILYFNNNKAELKT